MIKSVTVKDFGGDTSKRWYVEYREHNPEINKWTRRREYGYVNKEKDPLRRREMLESLSAEIMGNLSTRIIQVSAGKTAIKHYIDVYIADKKGSLKKTSIKNITHSLKLFYSFLLAHNWHKLSLHELRKNHAQLFRMELTKLTGNRSVNNHIAFVRSFFNYYIDNFDDIIYKNPMQGMHRLPASSENHVAYSDEQVRRIFDELQKTDPMLLLYCQTVGLAFIRCEEARHLKVSDIDFSRRNITVWAGYSKTRQRKVKPLLDVFYLLLMKANIYNYPAHHYLFSYGGIPGEKQLHYNYFRKRFKKLKDRFKLNPKCTIYSFRHTFVSQMLDNGAKWTEAMKYTGHTSMEGFSNYARSLHVKSAEDLSQFINLPRTTTTKTG